jgi:hypothetical protein
MIARWRKLTIAFPERIAAIHVTRDGNAVNLLGW